MMRPGETGTVIGRAARLRGELECAEDLQIDGDFEGSIRQQGGRLTVGPEARVRADVIAQDVLIHGSLEGDIRASGRVELRSSAVVVGDIFSGRLSMEENATLRGQVDPSRAGESVPAEAHEVARPTAVQPPPAMGRPIAVSGAATGPQEPLPMPTATLTQSGRQLPSALAAFAAGGRQSPAANAYRRESPRAGDEAPWRGRTVDE